MGHEDVSIEELDSTVPITRAEHADKGNTTETPYDIIVSFELVSHHGLSMLNLVLYGLVHNKTQSE